MITRHGLVPLAVCCAAFFVAATVETASIAAGTPIRPSGPAPIVHTGAGNVRGLTVPGVSEFLGLPYAAPPVGALRWRPPHPARPWHGVRDATQFAPSCPQSTDPTRNAAAPPGLISETACT